MSSFDDALEFRFKADTTWADAHEDDKAAVTRLWNWIDSCKDDPAKFLAEYNQYFGNDSPFAWYLITDYFMAVDNRAKKHDAGDLGLSDLVFPSLRYGHAVRCA